MTSPSWLRVVDALKAPVGTAVTVKGWLRTRRDSKAEGGLSFLNIHDGTCFDPIQVVCTGALPNYQSEITRLTTHCAVECTGVIVETPKGGREIQADPAKGGSVKVVGWVENPDHYPIQPKPHTMEFLREQAHLRVRTNTFGAVARIRHTLSMAIHRFFHERGFFWVHTPIITSHGRRWVQRANREKTPSSGATSPSLLASRLSTGTLVRAPGRSIRAPASASSAGTRVSATSRATTTTTRNDDNAWPRSLRVVPGCIWSVCLGRRRRGALSTGECAPRADIRALLPRAGIGQ